MKKVTPFLIFCLVLGAALLLGSFPARAQTQITFYTNKGTFVAEMYDSLQPVTAGNFISLVKKKFYDGVIFHRVIDGFMIQGGDPTGTGSGGPGYTIPDEFHPKTSNVQTTLAMANAGPNTGGSQFFINLVNNTRLDPKHPVFGKVISNFSVVQAIGKVPTNSNDKPLSKVVMDSVRITKPIVTTLDKAGETSVQLTVFPHPLTDESVFSIHAGSELTADVILYNCQGKIVAGKRTKLLAGMNRIAWNDIREDDPARGLYYLVIRAENSIVQQRIMVVH